MHENRNLFKYVALCDKTDRKLMFLAFSAFLLGFASGASLISTLYIVIAR